MSRKTIKICSKKVTQFLLHGTIVETQPSHDQFYSEIFPVPKKSLTDHRIILDLSDLNLFIRKVSFKMDSLYSIMYMIRPGDYFISIDIEDAYYTIAIHILSRPYLTFIFLGIYYQFTCLPQGLSSAPRIFTRVMRVVLAYLRTFGVRIAAWLDDLLLAAATASLAAAHTAKALGTLRELGFVPNMEKSVLTPTQKIEHLGLVWDSVTFTVSVPQSKLIEVKRKCVLALSRRVPLRLLSSILGSIEFFRWGFQYAAVYYRGLQRHVNACLAGGMSYNSVVMPSEAAKSDLRWWADAGDSLPPRSLAPFSASLVLYADASLQGWGGWVDDGRETFGSWSAEENDLHINVLEMRAVYYLFRCFFASASDCSVAVRSDNTSVVAYINHQGGPASSSLCDAALDLWRFCIDRRILVRASHVEGVRNCRADFLSRISSQSHSYFLDQDVFDRVAALLPFPLGIDCFASRLDCKLPTFFSRLPDPQSCGVDAFSFSWGDGVYLFPPVPIIDRVLLKVRSDNVGCALLICPFWPSQPWFSSLLGMLIGSPIFLPPDAVVDRCSSLPRHSCLLACPIGLKQLRLQVFRRGLPERHSAVSSGLPLLGTSASGADFIVGFIEGKVVTVVSL